MGDRHGQCVEGRLAFANGEAAMHGIDELPKSISRIELQWRDPIVVDPFTSSLAILAMPFHEVIVDTAGDRKEVEGYFTGVAEHATDDWKFRNAHWSIAPPTARAP